MRLLIPDLHQLYYNECSVHVHLKEGELEIAFIMDGGANADSVDVAEVILSNLERIAQQLSEFLEGKSLMLDAWVVTHWDAYHFQGVMQLLLRKEQGFLKRLKQGCASYFGHAPEESDAENLKKYFPVDSRITGEKLIGLDLFSGNYLFDAKGIEKTLHDKKRRSFCVFAASGVGVLGKQTIFENAGNVPSKNECSILSILSWPGHNARCSYFTGGDGNPELASGGILSFLRRGGE